MVIEASGPEGASVLRPDVVTRPEIVRSAMLALQSAGYTAQTVKELVDPGSASTMEAIFTFVRDDTAWYGSAKSRLPNKVHGDVAIVDVEWVLPVGAFEESRDTVVYPPEFVDWDEVANTTEYHTTSVAMNFFTATKAERVFTYHANASLQGERFRAPNAQYNMFRMLERIAERQIAGESDVLGVNYSLTLQNSTLYDRDGRDRYVNSISAGMTLLEQVGIPFQTIAAGNNGEALLSERYGPLADLNNYAAWFDAEGKAHPITDGRFVIGAADSFVRVAAPFTSKGDEAVPLENYKIHVGPGVHSPGLDIVGNKALPRPMSGTSFASPSSLALYLSARQYCIDKGIPVPGANGWHELLDQSIEELADGTFIVSPELLLERLDALGTKRLE